MVNRVVVTGIGPVSSIGIGREKFYEALLNKNACVASIPNEYEKKYKFKSRFYVPFPEYKLKDFGLSLSYEKVMSKSATVGLLATKLALEDAGLSNVEQACVVVGIGIGSLYSSFQSHIAHVSEQTTSRYNRMIIPQQMPNAVSAWISIIFGVLGSNNTLNASCASGTMAIGEAYRKVVNGDCTIALAGGVECLEDPSGSTMRGFDSLNVLTKSDDGLSRPFSQERNGFLFSDGAGCMLVLEELEHARKRNATVYAELTEYRCNSDAQHIVRIDPSGKQMRALLQRLANNNKIDYINTHGTATPENDTVEAKAIQDIFGKITEQPYLNASKGLLGHSLGASGALEAAITVLALKKQKIHGNDFNKPIKDLNILDESLSVSINCAASFSYGFGGHNAGLIFKRAN